MKLNLGSGFNYIHGYTNIDKFDHGKPDIVMDLEETPWKFKDNEVDEIMINHTLEHLGKDTEVFFNIIKELYRVSKNNALIYINVPHPRHDHFITDPTHVRIITPELFGHFSKENCYKWKEAGAANTPLAVYLDVDFKIINTTIILEKKYHDMLTSGIIDNNQLGELIKTNNNVASEFKIILSVLK